MFVLCTRGLYSCCLLSLGTKMGGFYKAVGLRNRGIMDKTRSREGPRRSLVVPGSKHSTRRRRKDWVSLADSRSPYWSRGLLVVQANCFYNSIFPYSNSQTAVSCHQFFLSSHSMVQLDSPRTHLEQPTFSRNRTVSVG